MERPLEELIAGRGFDQFHDGLRARFRRFGLSYKLTYCEPSDNPAMRLDFSNSTHIGRVTAWVSGACDLEVVEVSNGSSIFWAHHDLATDAEFHGVLPKVPLLMRDLQRRENAG